MEKVFVTLDAFSIARLGKDEIYNTVQEELKTEQNIYADVKEIDLIPVSFQGNEVVYEVEFMDICFSRDKLEEFANDLEQHKEVEIVFPWSVNKIFIQLGSEGYDYSILPLEVDVEEDEDWGDKVLDGGIIDYDDCEEYEAITRSIDTWESFK